MGSVLHVLLPGRAKLAGTAGFADWLARGSRLHLADECGHRLEVIALGGSRELRDHRGPVYRQACLEPLRAH